MKKIYSIYKYEWDDDSIYIGQTYHGSGIYGKISDYTIGGQGAHGISP